MVDVDAAVIGAGLAGLVCAQRLRQSGLKVVVLEKSRGLGGRLATRRLSQTWADHGVRCLKEQGDLTQHLIQVLEQQQILHRWTETVYELQSGQFTPSPRSYPRYASASGITAIAKFLGQGLEIWRGQRVQEIIPQTDRTWAFVLEPQEVEPAPPLRAKALIVAIPAPQASLLLHPLTKQGLPADIWAALQSVQFDPCITAIATYGNQAANSGALLGQAFTFPDSLDLSWVGVENSKQPGHQSDRQLVVVYQSVASFAQTHLDAVDLQPAGRYLIHSAAQSLGAWLNSPEQLQVHRWRYAFARLSCSNRYLFTDLPLPLLCSGDWCGGSTIEAALQSGLASALQLEAYWQKAPATETQIPAQFQSMIQQIPLKAS
ncbi:MAG: FAD-dependent oxidoreductase [Elainellaceae cyanobacterium]